MNLAGRVAIVTGGARGLGKGFADALLGFGAKVAVLDILDKEGQKTVDEFCMKYGSDKATYLHCDVACESSIQAALLDVLAKYKTYDILVNNAGINCEYPFERTIDINMTSVIRFCNDAVKRMSKDSGGNGGIIINIASLAGLVPAPLIPVYAATKHGVVGYTKSLAGTLDMHSSTHGMRVMALCPEFADTEIVRGLQASQDPHLQVYYKSFIASNIMPVSRVVEAFVDLLKEDTMNGSISSLTTEHGIKYMYPKQQAKKTAAKL